MAMNHPHRSRRWRMSPGELIAALNTINGGNQSAFARMIGVDGRTVRRWIAADLPIPRPVQALLRILLALTEEQRQVIFQALNSDVK